jgi:vancomycin resistance protein YoaR
MGSPAPQSPPVARARIPRPRSGTRARFDAPKRTSRALLVRRLAFGAGAVVLAVFFLAVAERIVYAGDVMPGIDVDGVNIATKGEDDAYADLSALATQLETAPLAAKIGDRDVSADPSLIDLDVDELATLTAARRAGRSGNPVEQTIGAIQRRFRSEPIDLEITYSEAGLEGVLDGWQAQTLDGRIEGDLEFEGTQVIEVEPRGGTGLLRDEARRRLIAELESPTREPVTLPVGEVQPRITREEVARAAAQARALLAAPVELVTGAKTMTILPVQIATALDTRIDDRALTLTLDPEELRAALGEALAALETAPVDAVFEVTAANTVQVVPSQNGQQVDMGAVATAILAGERRVEAPIVEVIPERNTAWAEGLGIKEEVSTFTTRHASGEARVTNIHVAADLLNNTIVEPGATFSLNDTIGPRTVDRGFVLAPVFYGEFTEDIGGGVSQLATTTFNAVFWGGYEDVFHKPHTIYISRYPMGREATVNYGTVDLQFRNDSNTGVLIRTAYSSNAITVTFYGDKEGKVVTEEGRKVLAERPVEQQPFECPGPPGLDKDNACATLPQGQQKLAEEGHAGLDVEFFRVITRPGQDPVRERFFWRYRMTPNKFLVGTAPPTTTTLVPPPTETTLAPPAATTVPPPATPPVPPNTAAAPTP